METSTNSSNYPESLYQYYVNSDKFEKRTNMIKKVIYYALVALCVILLIMPSLLPLSSLLVRILAVLGILIFGFAAYFGGEDYFNIASGGKITQSAIKKFDRNLVNEAEIMRMFDENDFEGLADAPDAHNNPLQLYIHEDAKGKVFYLQLMKYFSPSDFRGITEVKEISEPLYSQVYPIIKSIKSSPR